MPNQINFITNGKKSLEVILYLASKFISPTIYQVLKVLYFADIYHLNKYGRPIVGDRYVAMPYGPVPSTTYDIIKLDPMAIEWVIQDEEKPFKREGKYIQPQRQANLEIFSKSDIEALVYAFENYKDYDFQQFKDETHEHMAWKKAWQSSLTTNPPMDYADLIYPENKELEEYLLENSIHMVL